MTKKIECDLQVERDQRIFQKRGDMIKLRSDR